MSAINRNDLDFEALFEATASAYLLLDAALMIVGVNDAYLQVTNRSSESVLGRYVFDAFPPNPLELGASGVPALQRSLERVLQTRTADRIERLRFDIPTEAGIEEPFEQRYWSPINTPVFNPKGELTHIIHQAIDITKQVTSELARRESERRFKALTDASEFVVYRMSPDWSHMHQLDGRGFLQDSPVIKADWFDDYIPPEDQELIRKSINEAIRIKSIFELQHRVLRVDGSYGWTHSRAVPILDADGEIVEWIGSASDITAQKAAEERLKDANRRKDEFLAMLAHELRNPLAPISAAAELLQLGKVEKERLVLISKIISRQVKHLGSLVDDLLDVSRVTRGLVKLDFHAVDIKRVVSVALEQVGPLVESRYHRMAVHLPPESAVVLGDAKRLVQVVTNLLNNAAKYTPEGGVIDLFVQVQDEQVIIKVKDNGIGMAPEILDRVFDMFSQAQRTADRSQGGLGIGLALVKSLVELHHGGVVAKSVGQGYGSEFIIELPRWHASHMAQPFSNENQMRPPSLDLKIMVVDDNADAADALAMFLEALGHEVTVEYDAQRALERARSEYVHVFLLDIGLPNMDGNELARQLRLLPSLASSCLIAVTGYGQEQDKNSTSAAGFNHHFVKPLDITKLTSVLAEVGVSAIKRRDHDDKN